MCWGGHGFFVVGRTGTAADVSGLEVFTYKITHNNITRTQLLDSRLCCAVPQSSKMAGVATDSRIGKARMSACSISGSASRPRHPTSANSSTSSVRVLESSARLPWSVMSTSRSFQFTTRATRCHATPRHNSRHNAAPTRAAQSLASGTHRAHEYQMLRSLVSICTLD